MKLLKDRIRRDGTVRGDDVLKVDAFLNHQIDVSLLEAMGKEFFRLFGGCGVTKILTIEASGIAIACMAAQAFGVPMVFAKKSPTKNISHEVYTAPVESFTHSRVYNIMVSKDFLSPGDRVLIIDDFLANGMALLGLKSIVEQAGAVLVGAGVAIEKAFQPGGQRLRNMGVRVEALARIQSMSEESGVVFADG